jgi:hypothetical protein
MYSGKHNDEIQLYAFDILALEGDDLRNLARLLARHADGTACLRRPAGWTFRRSSAFMPLTGGDNPGVLAGVGAFFRKERV